MVIVDFHIHPIRSDQMKKEARSWQDRFYEGREKSYDDVMASPQTLLNFLKGQGVDYAVLLPEVSPKVGIYCPNEQVAQYCKGVDCLIPFASINPHLCCRPEVELENYIINQGFKGVKLYPTYEHFYPHDPHLYPFYQKARELNIPVMIHTGSSVFPGARLKYGDPLYIDDIAGDFPELTLIQVHGGRGFWYDRAFFLAQLHPNVYIDIAGLPPSRLLKYFPEFERNQDKIVFGSDWPGIPSIAANIQAVKDLAISEECKQKVLGENALRILGIR